MEWLGVLFRALSASLLRKSRVSWMSERDSLMRAMAALSGGRAKLAIIVFMSWMVDWVSWGLWGGERAYLCGLFVKKHSDSR